MRVELGEGEMMVWVFVCDKLGKIGVGGLIRGKGNEGVVFGE